MLTRKWCRFDLTSLTRPPNSSALLEPSTTGSPKVKPCIPPELVIGGKKRL
jgi:hypothetical protein